MHTSQWGQPHTIGDGFLSRIALYPRLVTTALICDVMVIGQVFIRQADTAEEDASVSAEQAASTLKTLRTLLVDGAIWRPEVRCNRLAPNLQLPPLIVLPLVCVCSWSAVA
jgi:hypothetical protein